MLTKKSLVYDLQEPFRWLVDLTIIQGLESDRYYKKDFIKTDDYIIRIKPKGVEKLLSDLDKQFSRTVQYKGYNQQWNTVIDLKAQEMAKHLAGQSKTIDLSTPASNLFRFDNAELREKILDLSYSEWQKMGFSKGSLWYMKKNAQENKPFSLNTHIIRRLMTIGKG